MKMLTPAQLSVCRASYAFGENRVLNEVNFSLQSGQILQICGENGSGKTTLLKLCVGLIPLMRGTIYWNKTAIQELGPDYHAQLSYLSHKIGLKSRLTVYENIQMQLPCSPSSEILNSLEALELAAYANKQLLELSAGQQRRVNMAKLTLSDSCLWVLDEPFTALDKAGQQWLMQQMEKHTDQNGMVLMSSHSDLSTNTNVMRLELDHVTC